MTPLMLGTRGSLLALTQGKWVAAELEANGGPKVTLEVIRTVGDERLDQPLHEISGQGLFTRELDEALLSGAIELAVHSLKDLPTDPCHIGWAHSFLPCALVPASTKLSWELLFGLLRH